MSYDLIDGKIKTEACEINVVQHCNLSCKACSHLSPMLRKHFADPDQVLEDLRVLSKSYSPEHIRLLGGEPLLHPALLDIVQAVRASGIGDRIRVLTNGFLLGRMPDLFWRSIDEVHVSIYPGYRIESSIIEGSKQQARKYGVDLKLLYFDYFREAYSELGADGYLTRRIYETCQIAQIWRCHTVHDGFLYRCPQSLFIPEVLRDDSWPTSLNEGLLITDRPNFKDQLMSFLLSKQPLESCRHCLGSVGKRFPHKHQSRLHERRPRLTNELVDWAYLELLEQDPHADNLCVRAEVICGLDSRSAC